MTTATWLEMVRAALPAERYLDVTSEDRGYPGYRIVGRLPAIAVRPRSAEEVALVLDAARVAGAAVVPLGAHTAMTLGRPLTRYDVALDMLGLDRIITSRDIAVEDTGVHNSVLASRGSDHLPVWARLRLP